MFGGTFRVTFRGTFIMVFQYFGAYGADIARFELVSIGAKTSSDR